MINIPEIKYARYNVIPNCPELSDITADPKQPLPDLIGIICEFDKMPGINNETCNALMELVNDDARDCGAVLDCTESYNGELTVSEDVFVAAMKSRGWILRKVPDWTANEILFDM